MSGLDEKRLLRKIFRDNRRSMTPAEISEKSRVIKAKLMASVGWSKVKRMHIYNSVKDWREVETQGIIKEVSRRYPEISLETASLDKNQEQPNENFDFIIVPVLAFDKDNYRLGLGGGFYDRFLKSQRQALKIGLAFAGSFVDKLPREPHDIPLDKVITEV